MTRLLPPLLLTGGPAVGKTTTAQALAEAIPRTAHVDVDDPRQYVRNGHAAPWDGAEGAAYRSGGTLNGVHGVVLGLVVLLASAFGGVLARLVVQRWLRGRGLMECAIRFAGMADSGRLWRHGAARPRPGRLEFLPYGASGWRTFQGRPFEFEVLDAPIRYEGRIPLRHGWRISPLLQIAILTTPDGPLELTAPPGPLRAICQELRSS